MSDVSHALYGDLFGDADVSAQFSSSAALQAMLDVESALAETQAALGIVPAAAAAAIARVSRAEQYDVAALAREAAIEGNVVIPLVRSVRRAAAAQYPDAESWVHFGITSQDVVDTALVLQLRAAVPLIVRRLESLAADARGLAHAHARTLMSGRTWLRQAAPTTFGLIAAGWTEALDRVADGLRQALERAAVVQLGGATGSLASLGGQGKLLVERVGARLGLGVPNLSWHAHRDRIAALACAHGVVCGTLGKIARDIALLGQDELGELDHMSGGGSSAMPQKRNPVGCAVALAAATRAPGLVAAMLAAMPQELERGLGGWHAEWETMAVLVSITGGAARACGEAIASIDVRPERMLENVASSRGAILAEALTLGLTSRMGREQSHAAVARACVRSRIERRPVGDVLLEDPEVTRHSIARDDVDRWMDPAQYVSAAETLVSAVLSAGRPSDVRD
jgi:3-carboxy-cis,cis-muconate cycloisomerase